LVEASERARADVAGVRAPVLMLQGGKDRLTPPAILFSTCAALADCRAAALPAGHHDLHMESDALREAWLLEIEHFIKARIAAKAQRHKG
jgi:lysophospholipase